MTGIIGWDLSLTGTGISRIQPNGTANTWRVASTGRKGATLAQRNQRLIKIRNEVMAHTREADLIVVEGPAYGMRSQAGTHDRSGLWWLLVAAAMHQKIPIVECPPTTRAKAMTDRGNADKSSVVAAVARMWPTVEFKSDDEADALALATIGAIHYRYPVPFLVLERHKLALTKIVWPDNR
ncbi:crossover junction endodeoxyribonuclease RuvC [Rhodococcus erythropolis]|uniref:Crossover junction endodeoxyribonuclease RuvC n=1 Tax=Rhodococcus erythropolis TaxID=1833 RepID=A0A8I1DB12_RHOER|nr:crossover junction endodeoxyribonuclease RuvC [Rhodococcus erythropolis]MBH5146313.1 crossover junction endodeoxyribonuclease RuvC [Rhodococcus erythropolis]